ncbi:MAG: LacI family transcriptional regulator [Rariglobus sp.]|jgi:LacI family transcriptional regulator|nr:LacI family transcriptional regulator [Rariglobus sp.]
MKGTRVTLADIARRAGVSRTAVSYALRDDPNIAPETRARIRKVADTLGYRPDPVLAKLMAHLHAGRGRTHAGKLAFLNVHEERDYWVRTAALSDFRRSAEARAAELGYGTEEFWLHEPRRSPRRLAQMLVARGIRGLVVGSTGRHGSVVEFPWADFAALAVGYSVEVPALHRVVTHHYRNTRLALRKVAEAGYSRVGFAADRRSEAAMENLHLAAFLAYQQEIFPEAERVPPFFHDSDDGGEGFRRWFDAHRPGVVLSTVLGRDELSEAGLRVPEDVPLVRLLLWNPNEGMAGVRPGYERLGAAAVNLLTGQLQHDAYGVPADPKIVQVEGVWCDGASLPVGRHGIRPAGVP